MVIYQKPTNRNNLLIFDVLSSLQRRHRRDGLRGRRKTSGGCARHLPRLDAHIETLQPGCNNFTINLHRQKDKT